LQGTLFPQLSIWILSSQNILLSSQSDYLSHWWRSNGLHHDFDQSETRNFNY